MGSQKYHLRVFAWATNQVDSVTACAFRASGAAAADPRGKNPRLRIPGLEMSRHHMFRV